MERVASGVRFLEGRDVARYCTILGPADEPERVVEVVKDLADSRGLVNVEGEDSSSITVRDGDVSLALNRLDAEGNMILDGEGNTELEG